MLNEMFRSLKGFIYERALSPLGGAFFVVWIGFNWKPISIYLLGQDDIKDRIAYIQANYVDINTNLWYPLACTVVIFAAYPLLASVAFYWWEKLASWQRKMRQNFDLNVPLSIPQSIELKKQLGDANRYFGETMTGTNIRVTELERENQKLKDELDALRPKSTPADVARAEELAEELSRMRTKISVLENVAEERDALRKQIEEMADSQAALVSGDGPDSTTSPSSHPDVVETLLLEALADAEDRDKKLTQKALEAHFAERGLAKRTMARYAFDRLKEQNMVYLDNDGSLSLTAGGRAQIIVKREEVARAPKK